MTRTATETQTATTTTSAATTPTVPGSVRPTDGHCSSGYVYLPSQDNGPALCIPTTSTSTSATTTSP